MIRGLFDYLKNLFAKKPKPTWEEICNKSVKDYVERREKSIIMDQKIAKHLRDKGRL